MGFQELCLLCYETTWLLHSKAERAGKFALFRLLQFNMHTCTRFRETSLTATTYGPLVCFFVFRSLYYVVWDSGKWPEAHWHRPWWLQIRKSNENHSKLEPKWVKVTTERTLLWENCCVVYQTHWVKVRLSHEDIKKTVENLKIQIP